MGHSTSVVALAAHPLGQHVLTAQKPQRKKMAMMEKGTKQTKLSLTFNTRYKCKLYLASYLRAVCRFMAPKKEVLSLRAFFKYCPV